MFGPTARISTFVRINSMRSHSGDCTRSTKSLTVFQSSMSRLNAVRLISRCQRTSQDTVSVSQSSRPRRGARCGDLGADLGMIAAATLGDVVQHDGQVERPPRSDFAESGGRRRVVGFQFAPLEAVQDADGPDRVLIDRVDVVHVILHLRDNAAEIRDEPAEDAGVAEPLQPLFRILFVRQYFNEQRLASGCYVVRRRSGAGSG